MASSSSSDQLVKSFRDELLLVEGKARLSAEAYGQCAKDFLSYLDGKGLDLRSVTPLDLTYYMSYLRLEKGEGDLTLAKAVSALRSFGSFLKREGVWPENVAMELDRPGVSRKLPLPTGSAPSEVPLHRGPQPVERGTVEGLYRQDEAGGRTVSAE